jgi:hypothetical protein
MARHPGHPTERRGVVLAAARRLNDGFVLFSPFPHKDCPGKPDRAAIE